MTTPAESLLQSRISALVEVATRTKPKELAAIALPLLMEADDALDLYGRTVRLLLDDYHDDHTWAIWASDQLALVLHQAEGCQVHRADCDRCRARVEASA